MLPFRVFTSSCWFSDFHIFNVFVYLEMKILEFFWIVLPFPCVPRPPLVFLVSSMSIWVNVHASEVPCFLCFHAHVFLFLCICDSAWSRTFLSCCNLVVSFSLPSLWCCILVSLLFASTLDQSFLFVSANLQGVVLHLGLHTTLAWSASCLGLKHTANDVWYVLKPFCVTVEVGVQAQ